LDRSPACTSRILTLCAVLVGVAHRQGVFSFVIWADERTAAAVFADRPPRMGGEFAFRTIHLQGLTDKGKDSSRVSRKTAMWVPLADPVAR